MADARAASLIFWAHASRSILLAHGGFGRCMESAQPLYTEPITAAGISAKPVILQIMSRHIYTTVATLSCPSSVDHRADRAWAQGAPPSSVVAAKSAAPRDRRRKPPRGMAPMLVIVPSVELSTFSHGAAVSGCREDEERTLSVDQGGGRMCGR